MSIKIHVVEEDDIYSLQSGIERFLSQIEAKYDQNYRIHYSAKNDKYSALVEYSDEYN